MLSSDANSDAAAANLGTVHHQFTFGGCVMSSSSLDSSSRSSKWNFLCPVVRESATAAAAAEQVRNRELWYGQSISHNFRGNNKLYAVRQWALSAALSFTANNLLI
ncbi:hypothetical protein TYRP_020454 [Tyrophagus putrescentiae]|nr:hypothetical protein TYRP_020454 [Tyrophagus putrescentiae]